MEPLAYLHLQLRLEGKEIVNECFLRQVEIVPGEQVPLVLLARLIDNGWVAYYDEGIEPSLHKEIIEHLRHAEFPALDASRRVLQEYNILFKVEYYKTYVFSRIPAKDTMTRCISKDDPKVKAFGFDGFADEVYTIERNSQIVSACVSTRENRNCGEAWVYTTPAYRHQGFAQKAVNAWARSLMSAGKIPFYSHEIENTGSAHLARKLGLQPIFEEFSITQVSREELPSN